MSVKSTMKGIGAHFLITTSLLVAETLVEMFLRWNPSGIDKDTIGPIIRMTNWFLIGTIAQFCVLAFVLILLSSVEELVERAREFAANLKRGRAG